MRDLQIEVIRNPNSNGKAESPGDFCQTWTLRQLTESGCISELHRATRTIGVIPPREVLNSFFRLGRGGKYVRWEPFELTEQEYIELSRELIIHSDGYCIEDKSLHEFRDFDTWEQMLVEKIRACPDFKPLSWQAQNDLIGIPIGEAQWIPRSRNLKGGKVTKVDHILSPLQLFFRRLEHCVPYCCAIAAYSFQPEDVSRAADRIDRREVVRLLDNAIIDLEDLDAPSGVVYSEMMNSKLMKSELLALLGHMVSVLSKSATQQTS